MSEYLRCDRCKEQFEELTIFDGQHLCETCKAIIMSKKNKDDLDYFERNEYFHIRTADLGKIAREILERLDEFKTIYAETELVSEDEIKRIILKNQRRLGE